MSRNDGNGTSGNAATQGAISPDDITQWVVSGIDSISDFASSLQGTAGITPIIGFGVTGSELVRRMLDSVDEPLSTPANSATRISAWSLWEVPSLLEGAPVRMDALALGQVADWQAPKGLSWGIGEKIQNFSFAAGENGAMSAGLAQIYVSPNKWMLGHLVFNLSTNDSMKATIQISASFNLSKLGLEFLSKSKFFGGPAGLVVGTLVENALKFTSANIANAWVRAGAVFEVEVVNGKPVLTDEQQEYITSFNDFYNQSEAAVETLPEPDVSFEVSPEAQQQIQSVFDQEEGLREVFMSELRPTIEVIPVPGWGTIQRSSDGSQIWLVGEDGTTATEWEDETGKNIAITYADGTVYIESDGVKTLYDASGNVVRQTISGTGVNTLQQGNNEADAGELSAMLRPFPYSDSVLLSIFGGDEGDVQVNTVMTATGLAKVIVQDGNVTHVVNGYGQIQPVANFLEEWSSGDIPVPGDVPASGDIPVLDLSALEVLTETSAIMFEYSLAQQAARTMQNGVDTWESQYRPIAEEIIKEIQKHPILFAEISGLQNLIDLYNGGDGAYRFVGGLAYLITGDTPGEYVPEEFIENLTFDQIDRTVDGLMDALNFDGSLNNEAAFETTRGKLVAALNGF
ncbi:MAG: hypothetical protein L3J13_05970, partial [Devosiaceae bacterium]|nr:hypothetical protein [Devosiaceae bacterium]